MVAKKGDRLALRHGAGAGEVALTQHQDFTGLAAQTETQVQNELATDGMAAIVKRDAIRLQTVADLYYQAILGASDIDRLDVFVKRYGWIAASALRAWEKLAQIEKANRENQVIDLAEMRGKYGDHC